jgi:hypothetical protein
MIDKAKFNELTAMLMEWRADEYKAFGKHWNPAENPEHLQDVINHIYSIVDRLDIHD